MIQKVHVPVSVIFSFNHRIRVVKPEKVFWDGKEYRIINVGLHHTYRQGRTLFHVFSVASQNIYFRLVLDTDTLFWHLEEISDGLPE